MLRYAPPVLAEVLPNAFVPVLPNRKDTQSRVMNSRIFVLLTCLLMTRVCQAFCFAEASARYDVPQSLLESIAKVESGQNPLATTSTKRVARHRAHADKRLVVAYVKQIRNYEN